MKTITLILGLLFSTITLSQTNKLCVHLSKTFTSNLLSANNIKLEINNNKKSIELGYVKKQNKEGFNFNYNFELNTVTFINTTPIYQTIGYDFIYLIDNEFDFENFDVIRTSTMDHYLTYGLKIPINKKIYFNSKFGVGVNIDHGPSPSFIGETSLSIKI